ncbi:MAG TPA: class GN sortase [Gammaproteobacteria bacterium]|nr:class GN sortase [Gammaproteobacteria bacterium]
MNWLLILFIGIGGWQLGEAGWIHAKAALAQALLAKAWEQSLAGETQAKPWPWADTWPVARLRMPERGVDVIVLEGVSGRTLAFGPGHMQGSVLPGERGNSVIAGHRDTHFAFLRDVVVNDRFALETAGGDAAWYQVENVTVRDSRRVRLRLDHEQALLTLVTCWPFDAVEPGGPLRHIVTARRLGAPVTAFEGPRDVDYVHSGA